MICLTCAASWVLSLFRSREGFNRETGRHGGLREQTFPPFQQGFSAHVFRSVTSASLFQQGGAPLIRADFGRARRLASAECAWTSAEPLALPNASRSSAEPRRSPLPNASRTSAEPRRLASAECIAHFGRAPAARLCRTRRGLRQSPGGSPLPNARGLRQSPGGSPLPNASRTSAEPRRSPLPNASRTSAEPRRSPVPNSRDKKRVPRRRLDATSKSVSRAHRGVAQLGGGRGAARRLLSGHFLRCRDTTKHRVAVRRFFRWARCAAKCRAICGAAGRGLRRGSSR